MKFNPPREVPMFRRRRCPRLFIPFFPVIILILWGPPQTLAGGGTDFAVGIGFDHLSRTIRWDGGESLSKLAANLVMVQGHLRTSDRFGLSVKAGLSLPSWNGLVFRELPISVEYQAGAAAGLALAAEIRAFLLRTGDFEIEGVGRIVSSFGFTKTWPLEGFAVEGNTRGRPVWFEATAGGRITTAFFGRFRPYLLVAGNFLWASFEMDQTLEDLVGSETKKGRGKSALATAFGASYEVNPRFSVIAEAILLPYPGGIDSSLSLGLSLAF
jgi:hypothetical protein